MPVRKDIKQRWELEMNAVIEVEKWEEARELGHEVTNSPT